MTRLICKGVRAEGALHRQCCNVSYLLGQSVVAGTKQSDFRVLNTRVHLVALVPCCCIPAACCWPLTSSALSTCSTWESFDADQSVAGELLDMVKSEIDRSARPWHPLRLPLALNMTAPSSGSMRDASDEMTCL